MPLNSYSVNAKAEAFQDQQSPPPTADPTKPINHTTQASHYISNPPVHYSTRHIRPFKTPSTTQMAQYPDGDWTLFEPPLTPTQRALIPAHRFDEKRVSHLSTLPSSEIEPLIPHLLCWMQDMHWPIAFPVADLLLKTSSSVIPYVRELLRNRLERQEDGTYDFDYDWQRYVLYHLVKGMSREVVMKLKADLEWARTQISDEKDEEYGNREVIDELLGGL